MESVCFVLCPFVFGYHIVASPGHVKMVGIICSGISFDKNSMPTEIGNKDVEFLNC